MLLDCTEEEQRHIFAAVWRDLEKKGYYAIARAMTNVLGLTAETQRIDTLIAEERDAVEKHKQAYAKQEQERQATRARTCARGGKLLQEQQYSDDVMGLLQQCDVATLESIAEAQWQSAEKNGALDLAAWLADVLGYAGEAKRIRGTKREQYVKRLEGTTVFLSITTVTSKGDACDSTSAFNDAPDERQRIEDVVFRYGARIIPEQASADVVVHARIMFDGSRECRCPIRRAEYTLTTKQTEWREVGSSVFHQFDCGTAYLDPLHALLERLAQQRVAQQTKK